MEKVDPFSNLRGPLLSLLPLSILIAELEELLHYPNLERSGAIIIPLCLRPLRCLTLSKALTKAATQRGLRPASAAREGVEPSDLGEKPELMAQNAVILAP